MEMLSLFFDQKAWKG